MPRSRITALAKLLFLIGLPICLLLALFGAGVHVGLGNRASILAFEKDWLGMDVEVPAATPWLAPMVGLVKKGASALPVGKAPETTPPGPEKTPEETPDAPEKTPETPPVAPEKTPETPPVAPETPPETPPPSLLEAPPRPAMPLTAALPERLAPDLEAIQRRPATVPVKVLVDAAWASQAADPFAYVQQTLAWASQVYESQIGLRLELRSIALWDDAPPGSAGKLAALCARPDDGAAILLGLVGDPIAGDVPLHGSRCALVPRSARSRQAPHLRPLLFAVGRLLGAAMIDDPGSDAYRRGSWMADVLADDAQPLWIDPTSREAMLRGKDAAVWAGAPLPSVDEDDVPAEEGE
ncbi:MAG: hypothetical protein KC420_03685 [Myxococcales bacterium]|nr:hypothetical protein [Myxococcales bacterium]MCB9706685.1 hypothetical protein [Myxococcales bacterium]